MTGYVEAANGQRTRQPACLEWELSYTVGTPCDSFRLKCPWKNGGDSAAVRWYRFTAMEGNEVVFRGVVDECETSWTDDGGILELSGRGMAAILLDNEAMAETYVKATIEDIVRDHVTPHEIKVAKCAQMPPVDVFYVGSRSSDWAVLYEFCRYYYGILPRFTPQGTLLLTEWEDAAPIVIGDDCPVTQLRCRDRRYGALSEIRVQTSGREYTSRLKDYEFYAEGGRASAVVVKPKTVLNQTLRYEGRFQIAKSHAQRMRQEIEIADVRYIRPGHLVKLKRRNWSRNGVFRVVEVVVGMDGGGKYTRLELAPPDILI